MFFSIHVLNIWLYGNFADEVFNTHSHFLSLEPCAVFTSLQIHLTNPITFYSPAVVFSFTHVNICAILYSFFSMLIRRKPRSEYSSHYAQYLQIYILYESPMFISPTLDIKKCIGSCGGKSQLDISGHSDCCPARTRELCIQFGAGECVFALSWALP